MAAAQLGAVLRHVRDAAARQTFTEQSDGALLRAFLSRNDQPAFEALVRRHGAMVLRVCRRTLGNVHDAEDALQATFLVLAQQATSIRKRESLASWLHGVAYRMATNAKRAAARRRGRESRVRRAQPPDPALSAAWQELQALLDQEIARLPESLRGPFVLCCLENKSNADVARQLGLQEGTIWNRLGRARKLLQERLSRRGVSLSAVLAAAAVGADGASAAVSESLVHPMVQAAAQLATGRGLVGGPVSGNILALVKGANQAMFVGKCTTAILLLLCTVFAGSGLGLAVLRGAGAEQHAPQQAAGEGAKGKRAQPTRAPVKAGEVVQVRGRVLDQDGKPVAGADVALLGESKSNAAKDIRLSGKPLAHGRADGDGRFRLSVARTVLADYRAAYVIAGKAGHGLAWAPAELEAPDQETLVRLAPEKVVRGRLIDVQGQPASGVRVGLTGLSDSARKDGVSVFVYPPEGFPAWPGPATTGKDGKFTLAGLNPDLGGALEIDGEEFTVASAPIQAGPEHRKQEVNLTLAPARILEGVVTAKDTGKPVPKALILCLDGGAPARGQTDEKGHYRVRLAGGRRDGFPSEVRATPPEGQPYLPYLRGSAPLEWPKGAVKHRIDLALARGVLVRGTVTDAATGKPIAGAEARALVTGGIGGLADPRVTTAADGAFALAVPPGRRGHVFVKGPNNDYVAVEITYGELQGGNRNGGRFYSDAVVPFETKAGMEALEVTAKLRRGVTIRGKLLGPGDKPVADAFMVCWSQLKRPPWFTGERSSVPVRDGTFELRGCDPEVTYPVYFVDARNKLGASVRLSSKEATGKEVTVRLEPCGSAVVRFLDKEGKPRKGFRPLMYMVFRPGDKGAADSDFLANVDTVNYIGGGPTADAEGRCTLPVLIPGATYFLGEKPKELLTVKSGETLKRDVVIEPEQ
jgi:RNA polymerase sigma factor (sigma-70 family)